MALEELEISKVTCKEIAIFWGLNPAHASRRLWIIKKTLNKKRTHWLTVNQYCQAEDISTHEFLQKIREYYAKNSHKKLIA